MPWFIETPKGTEQVASADHALSGASHAAQEGNLPATAYFIDAGGERHDEVTHTEPPPAPVSIGTMRLPRDLFS